jgi:ABC transporter related protein
VAYIYQDIRIFEDLTVDENLKLALKFSSIPKKAHESIIDSMLKRVGLDGFQPRTSKELSGGEKQRVAIARALISGKKLILADEPTGALDEENSRSVIHLIQDINKSERCTILMVTHSMLVAGEFAHRFWLRGGKLLKESDAL